MERQYAAEQSGALKSGWFAPETRKKRRMGDYCSGTHRITGSRTRYNHAIYGAGASPGRSDLHDVGLDERPLLVERKVVGPPAKLRLGWGCLFAHAVLVIRRSIRLATRTVWVPPSFAVASGRVGSAPPQIASHVAS